MLRRTVTRVSPSQVARAVIPARNLFFNPANSNGPALQHRNDNFEAKARLESMIHEKNQSVKAAEADLSSKADLASKREEVSRLQRCMDKLEQEDQRQERAQAERDDIIDLICEAVRYSKLEGKIKGSDFLNDRSISLSALNSFKPILEQYRITYEVKEQQEPEDLSDNFTMRIPKELSKDVQVDLSEDPEQNHWFAEFKRRIEGALDDADQSPKATFKP